MEKESLDMDKITLTVPAKREHLGGSRANST